MIVVSGVLTLTLIASLFVLTVFGDEPWTDAAWLVVVISAVGIVALAAGIRRLRP
jgi:hypothetical protein